MVTRQALNVTVNQMTNLRDTSLLHRPYEACSLLLGLVKDRIFLVKEIYHMQNLDRARNTFQMSGIDLMNAYEYSLGKNLDVIGIFHSHISGIRPSKKDMRFMEINPVVWLIYSVSDYQFGAYIMESTVKDVPIKVSGVKPIRIARKKDNFTYVIR